MNTGGAVVGSILAFVIPRHHRGGRRLPDADGPGPVTKPRRLLAMLLDLLGSTLVAIGVSTVLNVTFCYVLENPDAIAEPPLTLLGPSVAAALWLLVVLATGRSIGDLAVRIRYAGTPYPPWVFRPLRYLGGVGGYMLLAFATPPWSSLANVFALAALLLTLVTAAGRGPPGLVTRSEPVDDRR